MKNTTYILNGRNDMKRFTSLILIALISIVLVGCGNNKTTEIKTTVIETDNPLIDYQTKMKIFDYSDVELLDGIYKDVYDRTALYYEDELTVDDLLYGMRTRLHMDTKGGRDLSLGVGGNVMGQLMSATARYAKVLKTEKAIKKAEDLCDALYEINLQSPYFLDGQSMYAFEKYLTGCLDFYNYCGLEKGLEMAKRMVEYAMGSPIYADAKKVLGNNGPGSEIEWYTISEALYNFSETMRVAGAPVAEIKSYREFAKSFEYTEYWNIFYNDENLFDYSPQAGQNTRYFHAYSHLNTFNSAAKAYLVTNNKYYLDCINKFFKWFSDTEMMLSGGYGAHTEWFAPKDEIIDFIRNYHDNYETQCDTYASFRLANYMTQFNGTAAYGDWLERLLYNAVIASLDTEEGYAFYYSDYSVQGGSKFYTTWRWSCCSGSRSLLTNEVLRSIYYNDTLNLYVNQFINSRVNFTNKDNELITLTQETDMPNTGHIKLTLDESPTKEYSLKFRIPSYAKNVTVKVNNDVTTFYKDEMGWATIKRTWQKNDIIEIDFDVEVEVSTFEAESQYGPDGLYLINYGPVILAANKLLGVKTSTFMHYTKDVSELVRKGQDNLHYVSTVRDDVIFKPYYEYAKDEEYYMYFNMYF